MIRAFLWAMNSELCPFNKWHFLKFTKSRRNCNRKRLCTAALKKDVAKTKFLIGPRIICKRH